MENPNYYKLTVVLLEGLTKASLQNSEELIEEAKALFEIKHYARSYFLAVASIEETGKSQIAFEGQGRKLADTAVANAVKKQLEDHSAKITAAFLPWLHETTDVRKAALKAVDLMIKLKQAREPSMYTDIRNDGLSIHLPSAVVRVVAAQDCIRLATNCLASAKKRVGSGVPPKQTTRNEDLLYSMKSKEYEAVLKTEDFWWYSLHLMQQGKYAFENAVFDYKSAYLDKRVLFKKGVEPDFGDHKSNAENGSALPAV